MSENRKLVKVSKELQMVQDASASDYWWSVLHTLDAMFSMLRDAFEWAEGCVCHSHLD